MGLVSYVGFRQGDKRVVRRVERRGAKVIRTSDFTSSPVFDWGEGGDAAGANLLALAILADHLKDDVRAIQLRPTFNTQVVAHLRRESWEMDAEEVERFVRESKG